MAEPKTRPNDRSVAAFIARQADAARRADCHDSDVAKPFDPMQVDMRIL